MDSLATYQPTTVQRERRHPSTMPPTEFPARSPFGECSHCLDSHIERLDATAVINLAWATAYCFVALTVALPHPQAQSCATGAYLERIVRMVGMRWQQKLKLAAVLLPFEDLLFEVPPCIKVQVARFEHLLG